MPRTKKLKKEEAIALNMSAARPLFQAGTFIWGIDSSTTNFGFAIINAKTGKSALVERFTRGSDTIFGFSARISDKFDEFMEKFPPKLVAQENYAFQGHSTVKIAEFNGYWSVRLYYGEEVPRLLVAPSQLKKFLLGKGTGVEKDLMSTTVLQEFGVFCSSSDEADAFALSQVGRAFVMMVLAPKLFKKLPATRRDVVETLMWKIGDDLVTW